VTRKGDPQQRTLAPDFFISYTHTDREWAEWIASILEQAGYSTVLQSWDFSPGSNFVIEMQKAAASARHTIAVLSPDYLNSAYATSEWAAAFALDPTSNQRRLIPVRVRACEPEGLLKAIVFIDLVDLNKDEAARALLKGINAARQTPSRPPRFPLRRAVSVGAVLAVLAVILGAVVNLNAVWSWFSPTLPELYRIRVTVLESTGLPVDDANVWSSLGGEPKKVAGGWEFNIARSTIPKDGSLTVFASRPAAFEIGSSRLQLTREPNPAATLRLERDLSAQARGIVVDSQNRTIAGARVCVVGFESEAAATGPTGGFVLPAHAADGQQIQLHVEKQGYRAVTEFHPAGHTAVTIVLDPAGR
jgi:hypothetical protein